MSPQDRRTLLVTGASGQLGRRVTELLLARGSDRIVAATRNPDKIAELAKRGAVLRRADFDDAASMHAAFTGVERMLLISTDALDRPGRRFEQHRLAIEAAAASGVRHVVYTSLSHPDTDSPISLATDHRNSERSLAQSGMTYTALRNNFYTDYLIPKLGAAIASGKMFGAAGQGGAAYVTREDCAQAAAAALVSTTTNREAFEITGPGVVSHVELAALAAELSGRRVEYVDLTPEALRAGLEQAGLPREVAALMVEFDLGIAAAKFAPATSAVQDLTGRPPQSVAVFLGMHRKALLDVAASVTTPKTS